MLERLRASLEFLFFGRLPISNPIINQISNNEYNGFERIPDSCAHNHKGRVEVATDMLLARVKRNVPSSKGRYDPSLRARSLDYKEVSRRLREKYGRGSMVGENPESTRLEGK